MRVRLLPSLLLVAACLSCSARGVAQTAAAPQADQKRLATIAARFEDSLNPIEKRIADRDPDLETRELAGYALFLAMLHHDGPGAERVVRLIWDRQDMNPSSASYGDIHWNVFSDKIKGDANSIEFGSHFWGPLVLGYSKELSGQFLKEMKPHAAAALVAMQRHNPPVTYTNIFVMDTCSTILLSQITGDAQQAARGRNQLAQWMVYTSKYGIHEFDSPFYTFEAINDLSMGLHYTTDPAEHAALNAALDYFWKDVALSSSPNIPRSLLGAHSRDYDFFGGHGGGMGLAEWVAGLTDNYKLVVGTDASKVGVLDYTRPGGYIVDAARLRSLIPTPRAVTQRWGDKPNMTRYTWVTPGFAVGSADGDYDVQDKLFAVDFATTKDLPSIVLVLDRYDAPYGLKDQQTKDKAGHVKPQHLRPHPIYLQKEGSNLSLLDVDLSGEKDLVTLATNVVFPAKADEIRMDGKPVDVGKLNVSPAAPDTTVGVREGGSCFAFRFFHVDALGGKDAVYQLKADPEAKAKGFLRFAVYHTQGATSDTTKNLRVALISEAAACPADGLQALMDQVSHEKATFDRKGGNITVQAALAAGAFAVTMKDDARTATTYTIDGETPQTAPLAFDGHAILLQQVPTQP